MEHFWEEREAVSLGGQEAMWEGDGIIMIILSQVAAVYWFTLCKPSHICHSIYPLNNPRRTARGPHFTDKKREAEKGCTTCSKLHIFRVQKTAWIARQNDTISVHPQGHKLLVLLRDGHAVSSRKYPQLHDSGHKLPWEEIETQELEFY